MNLKQLQDKAEKEFDELIGDPPKNLFPDDIKNQNCSLCGHPYNTAKVIKELKQFLLSKMKEAAEGAKLDQIQTFRGALGMYNCQHGGRDCNFQVNCHRLIEEEIDQIKNN